MMMSVAVEKLTPDRRRAMTRNALLDAAEDVFARRGFEGASLDEIAETAGFTRGAIYKNFDGKADLFLAVFDRLNERILDSFAGALPDDAGPEAYDVPRLASIWRSFAAADTKLYALTMEFHLYALRNPEVQARDAAQRKRTRAMVTDFIERRAADTGVRLAVPAPMLASILLAASDGFHQSALMGDADADHLYEAFLEMIIPAVVVPADDGGDAPNAEDA